MDLDRGIVLIVRGVIVAMGALGNLAIRAGERIKAWQQSRMVVAPTAAPPAANSAVGGASPNAIPARQSITVADAPRASTPAAAPAPAPTRPQPLPVQAEQLPDELDWAGSLPHAAVASAHLGHVLALVRSGWLVPDESRLADVSAALDAMEAFQNRTASVIAPVLHAMTDDQRVEFFGDFDADFPPELPDLEGTP